MSDDWHDIERKPAPIDRTVELFIPSRGGYAQDRRFVHAVWSGWGGGVWESASSGQKLSVSDVPTHWREVGPEPHLSSKGNKE